jgi:steroid delta-isomerase-like uncharacterized protein
MLRDLRRDNIGSICSSRGENFMRRIFPFALVLLAIGLSMPQSQSAHPAGASPVAEGWITAWNSHDPAKWAAFFTSDIFYEDVTFGEISRGSAEASKFAASFFSDVPDLKLELVEASVEGNHGSIQWILSGSDKGVFKTGRKFKVRGASIISIDHGKISRSIDYYDLATIMKQLGVLPAS